MAEKVYLIIWILLHLLYLLSREIVEWVLVVWIQCNKCLSSCWPHRSPLAEPFIIVKGTQGLKKHPQHVAFLVTPEEADISQIGILQKLKFLMNRSRSRTESTVHGQPRKKHRIDVSALTKLLTWSWAANIPVVTLYDYYGEIKDLQEELMYSVQDEIRNNLWTVRKVRPVPHAPKVCFHNISDKNIPTTKANGHTDLKLDAMHILLASYGDGKPRILEVAKSICVESLRRQSANGSSRALINESELDRYFNLSNIVGNRIPSEPDILVISGNVKSTLGFLPWNIRLSEIFWIPKLPLVDSSHFLNVLETYSGCQQRFGT